MATVPILISVAGKSSLMIAVEQGNEKVVKFLIKKGADML